jgi:hypothetical protein
MIELDGSDMRRAMQGLRRGMAASSDKTIKRDVSKRLRQIMDPAVRQLRTRVMQLPSKGHKGQSMRAAIAKQTKAATRWSGQNTGVSIIQRARGMPRDFRMAGRAFNRSEGWQPQALGGITMHQQVRPAGWFDGGIDGGLRRRAQGQMIEALEDAAGRIKRAAS